MNKQEVLDYARSFVSDQMAQNDVGHDYSHVQRVLKLARAIAAGEPECDLFLVELVALLHDIDDHKLRTDENTLTDFLRTLPVDGALREKIRLCTGYVSYSKHPVPDPDIPLEARIVQDADRLDALGAVGIARTFAYTGAKRRPFYGEGRDTALAHFEEKLCHLSEALNTPGAKKIAAQRQAYLNEFYEQFNAELDLRK